MPSAVTRWLALGCWAAAVQTSLGLKASMTVAFAYLETTADLGWTWRHNQGRIYMHTRLLEEYPALSLQSIYEENVPEYPVCSPVFEQWAVQGVDLIVGTSNGYELCMAPLALKYPATVWLADSGTAHPNMSNWGTAYARIYQPTYLAGIIAAHASQSGKIGCVLPIKFAETQENLAAFALGVAHVNTSYEVHVGWTNNWSSPRHEILATRALKSIGVDVVWYRVDGISGMQEANRQGMFMLGFDSDDRMLLGESVLISPYFNWGVIYLQVAEMVLLETFASSTPVNLFPGMQEGAVALSDPSFLVKSSWLDDMYLAQQALLNGSSPFCGVIRTNNGTTVGAPDHCSNETDLATMMWQLFNVIDHGSWLLPSEACSPGTYSIWINETWEWACLPCPAGTHSAVLDTDTNETLVCAPCGEGQAAQAQSSSCQVCGPGTAPSSTDESCVECPADTYSTDGTGCLPCAGALESPTGATTCSEMQPTTNLMIVVAVVGSSVGISIALVAWVLLQRHSATANVMRNAPNGKVSIMFTDVHISTTLWDRCPEAMAWTLNQHSQILRQLLTEFHGYEVKTIGDAFMVIFQDAGQALQCAMRMQQELLLQHWPLELQQEESCSMRKDGLNELIWNGPRVRSGIHFGTPELVVNRQRGRVDYFGLAVTLTARLVSRACGGQTLITDDMRRQLPSSLLEQFDVRPVRLQYFKEAARGMEVFSVLPKALSSRVFTELKENLCLRCEGPTFCPKCDAVLDHGTSLPSRKGVRRSSPQAFWRSPIHRYAPAQTLSHEDLL